VVSSSSKVGFSSATAVFFAVVQNEGVRVGVELGVPLLADCCDAGILNETALVWYVLSGL
jgi:hypothetical protein